MKENVELSKISIGLGTVESVKCDMEYYWT